MDNLRRLRKSRGITQAELAQHLGISQNNYSYWETGKVKVDNDSLQKLADYFGVTVDCILDREPLSDAPSAYKSAAINNFVRDFGDLFADETFRKYATLYKMMNAAQRLLILGMIIGQMEKAGIAVPSMLR